MKSYYIIIFILLVSCQQKTKNKLTRLDLNKKKYFVGKRECCNDEYMTFEFQNKNDSLKGKVTHISFIEDSPSLINGTIKDSIIEFTYKESGIKNSIARGIIGCNKIIIILNNHYKLTLQEIDSNTYIKKHLKAYPKLITLKKDTVIGDYLFEIRVRNWNLRTRHGESTITIKDKTSKEEIQKIKSNEFYFYNKDALYFDYEGDYNFDNNTDLSFSTGTNGPYASYSANYYIYDKAEKKFIRSIEYENIANSVSFEVDTINKIMISNNKGSCCIHYTDAYKWKNNKIELVKSLIVDSQNRDSIILKERFNGKLKTIINKPYKNFTDKEIEKIYKNF